jgi:RimJ/RimL family protein N-acetyltransferase
MSRKQRWSVSWNDSDGRLDAREPSRAEVEAAAERLSTWYNEAHNRSMMANDTEMDPADVCEHFDGVWHDGGRNFILYADDRLMGDADLRHVDLATRTAEFAIMIGERNIQGRGYGTRFTLMLHALAFEKLQIERIYVSIIPANRGSLRMFEKFGYQPDNSPEARAYIDEPDDVTLSFARADFLRLHEAAASQLAFAPRPPGAKAR